MGLLSDKCNVDRLLEFLTYVGGDIADSNRAHFRRDAGEQKFRSAPGVF